MAAATTEQATATTTGASGYDEFVKDSENIELQNIQVPSSPPPEQTTAPAGGGGGEESWTKSIADGAQQAQGMIIDGAQRAQGTITNYFPPVSPCSGDDLANHGADLANRGAELAKQCTDLKDLKNPCAGGAGGSGDNKLATGENNNADEVPGLAASSSSEDGAKTKSKLADWADKLSSCHMDTACGKFELEFMKKEEKPEQSRANALTEQGELLMIDAPPPPKPWTEELSEKVHVAQEGATTKSSKLMVALGLAEKKDQHLITDYYKPKSDPAETEKSLSERFQEAQASIASVATTARGVFVSTAAAGEGAAPKEETKEEKQQMLITDFDPNRSEAAAAALTEEDIPAVISIATEPTEYINQEQESKPSSGWWSRVKGIFKIPTKVPTCDNVPKVDVPACEDMPKIDVPACSPLPKVEVPSFRFDMASCFPIVKAEEPKAEVSMAEVPKAEEPKAEEPKAEEPKAEVPKAEVPKTVTTVEKKEEKKEESKEQAKQEVTPEEKEEEQPAPVTSKSQNESSLPW